MGDSGTLGTCTEEAWLHDLRAATGVDQAQCDEFMADFWVEYLGGLNVELAEFVAALRPRCQLALLSNSFLGAREQDCYHFQDLTDLIIYSHEAGLAKPGRRRSSRRPRRRSAPILQSLPSVPHPLLFADFCD